MHGLIDGLGPRCDRILRGVFLQFRQEPPAREGNADGVTATPRNLNGHKRTAVVEHDFELIGNVWRLTELQQRAIFRIVPQRAAHGHASAIENDARTQKASAAGGFATLDHCFDFLNSYRNLEIISKYLPEQLYTLLWLMAELR
jgi:hypothetical protein